jgi:L-fuconolactonase
MTVTDAQVHLWLPDTPDRPWPAGTHAFAQGPQMSPTTMLAMMDEAGVDRAVLVPPSWEGDRNDYCAAAAMAHPDRFTVFGRVPLNKPLDADGLREWCTTWSLRGIRLTFARGASREWLKDGTADWLWPVAQELEIPVYLYTPGLIDEVAKIARQHPDLRISLDHLTLHTDLRNEQVDPELNALLPLSKLDNVAVKATSLPSYVTEPYPFPSLHARIARVLDAFGPRRVFWGSDVTRLPVPYRECVELFTKAFPFDSEKDRNLVMGGGLADWIGWPE